MTMWCSKHSQYADSCTECKPLPSEVEVKREPLQFVSKRDVPEAAMQCQVSNKLQPNGTVYNDEMLIQIQRGEILKYQAEFAVMRRHGAYTPTQQEIMEEIDVISGIRPSIPLKSETVPTEAAKPKRSALPDAARLDQP